MPPLRAFCGTCCGPYAYVRITHLCGVGSTADGEMGLMRPKYAERPHSLRAHTRRQREAASVLRETPEDVLYTRPVVYSSPIGCTSGTVKSFMSRRARCAHTRRQREVAVQLPCQPLPAAGVHPPAVNLIKPLRIRCTAPQRAERYLDAEGTTRI